MSSPIDISDDTVYISDDDESFDQEASQRKPKRYGQIYITDDEDEEPETSVHEKNNRQAVLKNLFPNIKHDNSTDDEEEEPTISVTKKNNRQMLIKNLFPNLKDTYDTVADLVTPVTKQFEHVMMIGGVSVVLPVKPYGCQIAVMSKVITAIKDKKHCLLESPTGTGKTLALLCAALAWQKKERDVISEGQAKQSMAQYPELNKLEGAAEYIASPKKIEIESAETFFMKRVHGDRSIYDSPQKQNINTSMNKRNEPDSDSIYGSPEDGLVTLQKKVRYNTPPTQKTPEMPSTPEKWKLPEEVTPEKVSVPIIYYGARTHKQIQQVVSEFGRTVYCEQAQMSLLSSREHSCLREYDRSQWPTKNDMCSSCIKPLSAADKIAKNQDTNCKFYDNRKALNCKALPRAFDLKKLVEIGERIVACPYYATREMGKVANIVFCPYNYLIEPTIRKNMSIDLKDNVVIIDEGHNIEDICRDAASFSFNRDQVNNAIKELEILTTFRYAVTTMMTYIMNLLSALKQWDLWFANHNRLVDEQPVNGMEATYTWKVEDFVKTLNTHNIGEAQYGVFNMSAEIFCRKFREDQRTLVGVTQTTSTLVESLDTVLGYLFRCSGIYLDDFKPVLVAKLKSEVRGPNAWRTSQFNKVAEKEPVTLRLICMNPAVVFAGLHPARCIILASGTLTPKISMQSELATDFPLQISPKHIIPSDRVWIGSLYSCPDGSRLDCTSNGTKQTAVQDALGEAVLSVCRVTPHGVLCFFPSYQRMNSFIQRWKQIGLWGRVEGTKNIFIESNDAKDHEINMEDYYECVGTGMGALLCAVYRGKVAEGMDFKDRQARAVITIGVPFPSKFDIAVSEKMKFNDKYLKKRNLLSGDEWYRVQAYRALNQAVGRCVRHVGDWGAVLLLDARFREPHYTQHLSAWVKEYLGCNHHTLASLVNGSNSLKSFMEEMTRRENQ
ncbi:Fanconi anemia group J protein isoform X2 [Bicyclus anynana]|uniref:Fanconi anemia group J protein isoform X2 n=1 Tax=Bicyclus anynana TaxID=110368 RepID=A0ABM3LIK9_BICAN|nr:Fanconi anemia group J protein isoform X2 [Bicyclus anynana]